MNALTPTVPRSTADIVADLDKLFQDRATNSPASQWEMVSLPLLQEIMQVLSAPPCTLSLPDQYWLALGQKMVLEQRKKAGEAVEDQLDDLLSSMDTLWFDMSPDELEITKRQVEALKAKRSSLGT